LVRTIKLIVTYYILWNSCPP